MSFEAESNSELTVIIPTYQLHFRFPVQNKIHKQNFLSDTRIGILASIAGPCDFLPDEFQKYLSLFRSLVSKYSMVDKALCSLIHDKIQFIMATTNQDFF